MAELSRDTAVIATTVIIVVVVEGV